MTAMPSEVDHLKSRALKALESAAVLEDLESWRIEYIGRKGAVPRLLRKIKDLPVNDRREAGQSANHLRRELEDLYQQKKSGLAKPESGALPVVAAGEGREVVPGAMHPISLTTRRIQEIMAGMGFVIVEGPEAEQEYYDFDALNIPLEHSARAETDSFFLKPRRPKGQGVVMRSSTSAVQVRTVIEMNLKPPFQIASPGRVFRNEKPDPTHESMFHQVEALMVGESVTIADYKGVTETFFSTLFSREAKIRLRPGYFPFVEPGFEVDMTCPFCNDGCRICKFTCWIEMGGAGMVHPNVLKNMNIDTTNFQGFAFGYGIDRISMLWHGIDDIRLFWSGDIRFLRQFS